MFSSKNDCGIPKIQPSRIKSQGPPLLIKFDLHTIIVVTFIYDNKGNIK